MRLLARSKIAFVLPLTVLVVAALIGVNEFGYRRSSQAAASIAEEQKTRVTLHLLMQQVLDAETGQRGYLLTGDEKYLAPYAEAASQIGTTLDRLRSAYVGDSLRLDRFAEMSRSLSRKLAELEVTIKLRRVGGNSENWMQVTRTDLGRDYMTAFRESALDLIGASTASMDVRQQQIDQALSISRIGVSLAALLGLLAFVLYLRQTARLDAAAEDQRQALAIERDGLEKLVRDRTSRLTVLANHLQVVQEQERAHLARELHDELGALLTAAKLDVARLRSKLPVDNEAITQRFAHLTETLNAGIALKRRIVEDLRPSSLSNLGLVAALEILARDFSQGTGVEVATDLEPATLNDDLQLTIYRVVQEALTNITKYARAKEVSLALHVHEHLVELNVVDDGQGFNLDARLNASHGFAGMRHRIEALNGALTVESREGHGTRIRAVLPVAPAVQVTESFAARSTHAQAMI
jgi:signal transduction histidine kinase